MRLAEGVRHRPYSLPAPGAPYPYSSPLDNAEGMERQAAHQVFSCRILF
jgi:hypothetical protein